MRSRRLPLSILLLSGFLDYAGVAIVYPLLAYMLFDPSCHFLPQETSNAMRGLWLGILIALHPLFQFFFSPIFGSLSDLKGRKNLLLFTFWIGLIGYVLSILGIYFQSLTLLVLYRILEGVACGNCSIVSAITADISTPEKKAKYYGLLNMSFGAGFTLGPFLSGVLADSFGLVVPFVVAFALVAVNLFLVWWKLEETRPASSFAKVRPFMALTQIKLAAQMPHLRFIFLALLIFSLGWSFFTEFISLFLIDRYAFNPTQIGMFYGYTGACYSVAAGVIIFPIIRKLGLQRTLFLSMLFSGVYLLFLLLVKTPFMLWFYLPLSQFFLAFAYPVVSAIISNRVSKDRQGEVMGIYQSVIALALTVTPFLSGSFIGDFPALSIILSGILMAGASGIVLFQRETSLADSN